MKIKVLVEEFETKEGEKFKSYKMIDEKGKKVDLRLTMQCAEDCAEMISQLNKCKKAMMTTSEEYKISNSFEFPRIYINDIKEVEKLI